MLRETKWAGTLAQTQLGWRQRAAGRNLSPQPQLLPEQWTSAGVRAEWAKTLLLSGCWLPVHRPVWMAIVKDTHVFPRGTWLWLPKRSSAFFLPPACHWDIAEAVEFSSETSLCLSGNHIPKAHGSSVSWLPEHTGYTSFLHRVLLGTCERITMGEIWSCLEGGIDSKWCLALGLWCFSDNELKTVFSVLETWRQRVSMFLVIRIGGFLLDVEKHMSLVI